MVGFRGLPSFALESIKLLQESNGFGFHLLLHRLIIGLRKLAAGKFEIQIIQGLVGEVLLREESFTRCLLLAGRTRGMSHLHLSADEGVGDSGQHSGGQEPLSGQNQDAHASNSSISLASLRAKSPPSGGSLEVSPADTSRC